MANYVSNVTIPTDGGSTASYNIRELFPHVGNCTVAASAAAKTVTIGNFKLYTGAWVVVKFSNTNSADVASLTLNVDGTGAKPIKYRNANLSSAGLLIANRYTYFVYDGTNYQIVGDFDTNSDTYDRNRYKANIKAGTSALVAANIIVGKDGVFNHLKSGGSFDISYPILYLNGAVAAGETTNNSYDIINFTITTTQSISLTAYLPVFIKGTLSGKIFTPVSTAPLTQTVPTTDDGYQYMYLGNATSTSAVYLTERHPIYVFKNNAFGEIVHTASNATQDGDGNTIGSTYLKLSGGTMTGDIEYAGDGNRKIALGKNSFKYYVASNAGWAGGLSYYSNDGSTGLGYFGAYGQANTLEYHFIGGTYNAPQIKIEPTGPNLIINSEDASTPMITFFRKGSNKADWRIVNTGGNLKFQSDYTTTVGDWYDALTVEYNTGNITMKTNATFTFGKFGSASANANRHVFFKEDGANRICVNDNFKYNPSTNILTVGSITGSAATWTTGRTLTIGSTGKSVDGSGNVSWTLSEIGAAASSHAHGNITSGGALQTTDITIASGDKLVVTDSSNSNKVARASISFDGSTTSKCLTQKGTWETFASSNTDTKVTQNIVATTTDKNYPLLLSYYESSSSTTTAQTANRAVGIYANAKTPKITLTSGTANTSPGITATRTDTNASVSLMVGSGGTNHGVYSESMQKWLFVADGTEAQTYNVAKNPSTATTYAISFGGAGETSVEAPTNGTFTTGIKGHYINDGLGYRTREGVANGTEGLSALVLGNSLASSVANNKTGYVRQYSVNKYYTDLKPNTLTASRTILLPDASGTIAVFPAARTSGQVVVTDGTAGGIKSSGYTIAKSVPSDAKFTDENVKQSETTTNQYRPIVFGATYSTDTSALAATITGQTYVSNLLYAQPEGGILYANRMYLKAPGSKGQLNLLTSKYNVMLRNDDSNTYFLVTAQNDPTGTWTSARPLTINNSTGVCSINGNATTATRADYVNVVAGNEIRFYNNNQLKANDRFWIGYSWADGSHYTPSGGSDTSSTTAPNITKFIMGNCSAGGLASVHAKTFILGNGSSPTYSSKTTTITTAATTTDRTITLPDASGTLGVAEILFNTPTNSTDPVSLSSTPLSDYNYFTIIFSMNGANSDNSSSAIVPAVDGKHFALFRVNETTEYMMFPITIMISTYGNATTFGTIINRGISIPYSGSSVSIVSARTAYIKMIIGHKS